MTAPKLYLEELGFLTIYQKRRNIYIPSPSDNENWLPWATTWGCISIVLRDVFRAPGAEELTGLKTCLKSLALLHCIK